MRGRLMDTSLLWRSALVQLVAGRAPLRDPGPRAAEELLRNLGLADRAGRLDGLRRDHRAGAEDGPQRHPAGALLAGLPSVIAVLLGAHDVGGIVSIVVFGLWCGWGPRREREVPAASAPRRRPHCTAAAAAGRSASRCGRPSSFPLLRLPPLPEADGHLLLGQRPGRPRRGGDRVVPALRSWAAQGGAPKRLRRRVWRRRLSGRSTRSRIVTALARSTATPASAPSTACGSAAPPPGRPIPDDGLPRYPEAGPA